MFSSPTSRWTSGAAVVCLGVVAVSYLGLVSPKRGEAADLASSAASTEQQNDLLQVKIAQLRSQFATLPQRQAELSTVLAEVPVDADVPHVVRSLDALAADAGVNLDAVTPGTSTVLDASGHPATGATATASGADGGVGQVVGIPLTLTVNGPYFKAVTFLKGLQGGQRAFLVTGLQMAVAGADVTMTVKGEVFALPGAAAALAALAPAGRTSAAATPPATAAATPPATTSATPLATTSATPAATPAPSASASASPSR